MVADRKRFVVNNAVGCAETTIMDQRIATVLNFKRRSFERTSREAHLIAFRVVYVVACRCLVVSVRVESIGVLPLHGIEAC